MKIVAISDTHGHHRDVKLPKGDMLIFSGDMCGKPDLSLIQDFTAWMADQDFIYKILIAGNHDFPFQNCFRAVSRELCRKAGLTYLEDSGVICDGIHIYGSPWQPWFYDWAFNLHRGKQIKAKWDLIPEGTDILITHGPPHGILDLTSGGQKAGCEELLSAVCRVNPSYHIFGHIHEGYGIKETFFNSKEEGEIKDTVFINAALCDSVNRLVNEPIVFDW